MKAWQRLAMCLFAVVAYAGCGQPEASPPGWTNAPAIASVDTPDSSTCGESPLPACPLQVWMEDNAALPLRQGDYATLTRSFAFLAHIAPAGMGDWTTLAARGAAAARRGDLPAIREACTACHQRHRGAYRRRMCTRPLPDLTDLRDGQ